jgi:hypothetical protein
MSFVAGGKDICHDVGHGERREVGDRPVKQPRLPLAPLAGEIIVGHRSLD